MLRTLRVAASGLLTGLLIGILGVVTFVGAIVWDDRRRMAALGAPGEGFDSRPILCGGRQVSLPRGE